MYKFIVIICTFKSLEKKFIEVQSIISDVFFRKFQARTLPDRPTAEYWGLFVTQMKIGPNKKIIQVNFFWDTLTYIISFELLKLQKIVCQTFLAFHIIIILIIRDVNLTTLKKILYLHPPIHALLNQLLIKSLTQTYYLVDSTKNFNQNHTSRIY